MKRSKWLMLVLAVVLSLGVTSVVRAESASVVMNKVDASGIGEQVGTILLTDTKDGLVLAVNLQGLPPGEHGFHVHEFGSCEPAEKDGKAVAALKAGGHLDPGKAGAHAGPEGSGHLGDLPLLVVDAHGHAKVELMAKRLKVADVRGHAIMVHEGGDNFADAPKPLGGGGARIACGVAQ